MRYIRIKEVCYITSLSKSEIYRRMRDGDFPNSFKIGKNATAWIEEDIEVWIRKTVLESRIETEYFS